MGKLRFQTKFSFGRCSPTLSGTAMLWEEPSSLVLPQVRASPTRTWATEAAVQRTREGLWSLEAGRWKLPRRTLGGSSKNVCFMQVILPQLCPVHILNTPSRNHGGTYWIHSWLGWLGVLFCWIWRLGDGTHFASRWFLCFDGDFPSMHAPAVTQAARAGKPCSHEPMAGRPLQRYK